MKSAVPRVAAALLVASGTVLADVGDILYPSSFIYADGFVYCRTYDGGDPNSGVGCYPDIGDFPAKTSFELRLHPSETTRQFPIKTMQLAKQLDYNHFEVYNDVMYLDSAATAPVGFKDPSGLTGTEVSSYWATYYGYLFWGPNDYDESAVGAAFQYYPVGGYSGLWQLYFNQDWWKQKHNVILPEMLGGPANITYIDHP